MKMLRNLIMLSRLQLVGKAENPDLPRHNATFSVCGYEYMTRINFLKHSA